MLDGEVCALDEQGRPSFSAMQPGTGRLVYYAFDLLEADGEPLVDAAARGAARAAARRCSTGASATVRFSEGFDDGEALLAPRPAQGLEGVMAKRRGSPYREGKRTRDWLKVKTHGRQEFVVAGYTRGEGTPRRARSARSCSAVNEGGELRYVGNVGTGFDEQGDPRLLSCCSRSSGPTRRSRSRRRCRVCGRAT